MKPRWTFAFLGALLAGTLAAPRAAAQEGALVLRITRTFGYGFGSDIQGSFALTAEGPADLVRVRFYVDESLLADDPEAPFRAQLHTGDFPMGIHSLWAEGDRSGGGGLVSNSIEANFVSASAGWDMAGSMLAPVLIVVGLAMGVSVLFTAVSGRRYRPGVYGSAGGAVCPRCSLPMSRNWFSPNFGRGKLERCPHCGKWSVVGRASTQALSEAEVRLGNAGMPPRDTRTAAEDLKRKIDDSRFTD